MENHQKASRAFILVSQTLNSWLLQPPFPRGETHSTEFLFPTLRLCFANTELSRSRVQPPRRIPLWLIKQTVSVPDNTLAFLSCQNTALCQKWRFLTAGYPYVGERYSCIISILRIVHTSCVFLICLFISLCSYLYKNEIQSIDQHAFKGLVSLEQL